MVGIKFTGKNLLLHNDKEVSFSHEIRQAEIVKNRIVVLLGIPYGDDTIDNIFAVSCDGSTIWRVQDENPPPLVLPYERIRVIENDVILANDFDGLRSYINVEDGKVFKKDAVK